MKPWDRLEEIAIAERVRGALEQNLLYTRDLQLGVPGSHLDTRVFPKLPFVDASPFLSTFFANPNHIGVHTLGQSEGAFAGTQALEREALQICAERLLDAEPDSWDGYVAAGGTESNIQACWCFRNALRRRFGLQSSEIAILFSADTHYSVWKAADLLGLRAIEVPVDAKTRRMRPADVERALRDPQASGVRGVIAWLNMGTTMFGSVDEVEDLLAPLAKSGLPHHTHVDGAFGGFIHPLTAEHNALSFADPRVESITLDAHKMLQAPYGTGIHLIRRPFIAEAHTSAARYVPGGDSTLSGSRSGTNAIAVWMILRSWGSEGGRVFCRELIERAQRLCDGLESLGIEHFRAPSMNVVTLDAAGVPRSIAAKYRLVPDSHDAEPAWWKVVLMPHVERTHVAALLDDLRAVR
ncbi:MAG: aspartate aminotransferase family protein [Polyangiaceae bacterium]|nr:aspartate aminotransferase family protein [Polyangiaceae bacterium]